MNDAPVRQVATPQPYSDFDRLPIGGGWRRAKTSHVLADRDPYTGQVILEIPQADRSDQGDGGEGKDQGDGPCCPAVGSGALGVQVVQYAARASGRSK